MMTTKLKSTNLLLFTFIFAASFSGFAAEKSELTEDSVRSIPAYEKVRPNWGIQLEYFRVKIPVDDLKAFGLGNVYSALDFEFMYQPELVQDFGVLGIGLVYNPYFTGKMGLAPLFSFGGRLRYQFYFSPKQLIVPSLQYDYGLMNYTYNFGKDGSFDIYGPGVGLWLNTNFIDKNSANWFYVNFGVNRNYITFDVNHIQGADKLLSIRNKSYKVGLRVEFN
jgi:hypothetical protein